LDTSGNAVDITLQGNEPAVALAKQIHNDWLETDKHILSLINDAVPIQKTWVIQKCKSSHDAWNALCKEFEPNNSLAAMNLNQQITTFSCQPGADPAAWLEIMLQLYGKLCQADPTLMSDFEFSKMLITHMCKDETWRYCQAELRAKLVTAQETGIPLSSSVVVSRLKSEEIHHGVAPSVKAIQNLVQSAALYPSSNSAVPSLHLAQTSAAGPSRSNKSDQRNNRRVAPYTVSQRSTRAICDNKFCETPSGHSKDECFSFGGGRVGKYPASYTGRRDLHLPPEARIAVRHKRATDALIAKGAPAVNNAVTTELHETHLDVDYRDSPMEEDEEFTEVFHTVEDGFAFMADVRIEEPGKEEDELTEDEQVEVHPRVFNLQIPQTNFINHDTGATRHIFVNKDWFQDYSELSLPLKVHGFGSNLSATAIGKGTIILKTTHNKVTRQFSLSNVLHIPTARSNLISGSRLDKKGVSTLTGKGKITYLSPNGTAFASGEIVDDLYQMAVIPVKQPDNSSTSQDLIAAMAPSITAMLGPDSGTPSTTNLGFTTV
jgi:hypothetical protein